MELFDYLEVFYNQRRRHSTLEQIVRPRRNWLNAPGRMGSVYGS